MLSTVKKYLLIAILFASPYAFAQDIQADYKEIYGEFEKISPDVVYIMSLSPGDQNGEKELQNFYDPASVKFMKTGVLVTEIGNQKIVRFFDYRSIQYIKTVDRLMYLVLH